MAGENDKGGKRLECQCEWGQVGSLACGLWVLLCLTRGVPTIYYPGDGSGSPTTCSWRGRHSTPCLCTTYAQGAGTTPAGKVQFDAGTGPLAIISDIHANLEALTAVLADIDARGIKRIICLGDVVGYGPNPLECMDLVMQRCEFSLMGNHDFAIFYEPANFNPAAENASFWRRACSLIGDPDLARRNNRWRYLGSMPTRMVNERFVCFHGSPRKPINEYVFAADIYSAPLEDGGNL